MAGDVRSSRACFDEVCSGEPRLGWFWQARLVGAWQSKAGRGRARQVMAGRAWHGQIVHGRVSYGEVRSGMAGIAR